MLVWNKEENTNHPFTLGGEGNGTPPSILSENPTDGEPRCGLQSMGSQCFDKTERTHFHFLFLFSHALEKGSGNPPSVCLRT